MTSLPIKLGDIELNLYVGVTMNKMGKEAYFFLRCNCLLILRH